MSAKDVGRSAQGLVLSLGCIAETAAICLPTVAQALAGSLTPADCDRRLERWARRILAHAQVELRVVGALPTSGGPFVVMSNHASFLDIPVVYKLFGGHLRMVAKKELFQVPVFGRAMLDAGFVRVDRSNHEAAVRSIDSARDLIDSGLSVWIAPEGTRSTSGRLGTLKKGGFMLALQTGRPILPITLRGTAAVLPPGSLALRPAHEVEVIVHAPLDTAALPRHDDATLKSSRDRLMSELRAVLEASL